MGESEGGGYVAVAVGNGVTCHVSPPHFLFVVLVLLSALVNHLLPFPPTQPWGAGEEEKIGIGSIIRMGRESECLLYAEFLSHKTVLWQHKI